MTKKQLLYWSLPLFSTIGLVACLGGSSSNNDRGSGGGNPIAVSSSYTADTAFGSPFVSTSSSVIAGRTLAALTPTQKREQIQALLDETDTDNCNFDLSFTDGSLSYADCYGPELNLGDIGTQHPDQTGPATIPNLGSVGPNGSNPLPTGDLGIWSAETSDGSACAASQVNRIAEGLSENHHIANMLGAAAECYFDPTNEGSVNLTSSATDDQSSLTAFQEVLNNGGDDTWVITTVEIAQIEDDSGNSGVRYQISGTWTDVPEAGGDGTDYSFSIATNHINGTGDTLQGSLSYAFTDPEATPFGNCTDTDVSSGMTYAGDLIYDKQDDDDVTIEAAFTSFCGEATPLGSASENFRIDPCDFVPNQMSGDSNDNGWGNNYNYAVINYDPSDYDGTYAYAWQAGPTDRATRVFNATISTSGSTRSGEAYFGYGPMIQDNEDIDSCTGYSEELGGVTGMICNWAGPGHSADGSEVQEYVQYQEMTANTSDNIWTATTSQIKYAPVTACEYDPTTFNNFNYNTEDADSDNDFDQVAPANQAATLDLMDFADYDFSLPTAPTLSISE